MALLAEPCALARETKKLKKDVSRKWMKKSSPIRQIRNLAQEIARESKNWPQNVGQFYPLTAFSCCQIWIWHQTLAFMERLSEQFACLSRIKRAHSLPKARVWSQFERIGHNIGASWPARQRPVLHGRTASRTLSRWPTLAPNYDQFSRIGDFSWKNRSWMLFFSATSGDISLLASLRLYS